MLGFGRPRTREGFSAGSSLASHGQQLGELAADDLLLAPGASHSKTRRGWSRHKRFDPDAPSSVRFCLVPSHFPNFWTWLLLCFCNHYSRHNPTQIEPILSEIALVSMLSLMPNLPV